MENTVMANRMQYPESDSRHHTAKIRAMLEEIVRHARKDVGKVTDPKAQALFETTAEVLTGLCHAYTHAEEKTEVAWK